MEPDRPRDRREGSEGTAPPSPAAGSPRQRFREFLADRMGGMGEAEWYLAQVMPRFGADPEARLAAEELLDHIARLMHFQADRPHDGGVALWQRTDGPRIAVALVDPFEAVTAIGRAAHAAGDLRHRIASGDELAGVLCVVAGEVRRRPIEQLLEVRRMSLPIRVVGLASVLALARAVEAGSVSPAVAAAVLEPGAFADALVARLAPQAGQGGLPAC